MTAGEDFVKKIKPFGCVLFLALFVGFLVFCFTGGGAPVKGYSAPRNADYYAEHLDELQTELEQNLFPKLQGVCGCEIKGDKLSVAITDKYFDETKSDILFYYDKNLFVFQKED